MDTTVFDQNSHNYASTAFKKLAELVKENKVKIYLTTITTREVESHIKEEVESAQSSILNTFTKHRFLKHSEHPSVSVVFEGMDVEEVTYGLWEQFRNWMSEMAVELITIEDLPVEEIFDNYFDRKPPFSEKKKTEFPDAFTLAALEKWCEAHKAKMYVISADNDMSSACELSQSLRCVKSLSALLELLTEGENLAIYANELFEAHKDLVINRLKQDVNMYMYWPFEQNEHLVYSYMESISFPEKYLIEVEEEKAVFDVLVKLTLFKRVRRPLPALMNMGIMMREEEKRRNQFLKAEIGVIFDKSNPQKFQIEYANVKEANLWYYPQYSDYPDLYTQTE
jgi:hypothetical protein